MITVVRDDQGDWIALYKDGKLLGQGHSFETAEVLRMLGVKYEVYYDIDPEPTGWKFPDDLNELDLVNALGHGENGIEL